MILRRRVGLVALLFATALAGWVTIGVSHGQEMPVADQGRVITETGAILAQRHRITPVNEVLRERLDELLPRLMRETGIDMWLVLNREYAEDPVYFSLVPDPVFAARRTTMLVFFDRGEEEGVERLTVSRYGLADLYEGAWEGGDLEEQWVRLSEVIRERDPRKIAINTSRHWAVADGLTAGLHERLTEALGPELSTRLVSAEDLVVRWLETRTARELEIYPHVVALARSTNRPASARYCRSRTR